MGRLSWLLSSPRSIQTNRPLCGLSRKCSTQTSMPMGVYALTSFKTGQLEQFWCEVTGFNHNRNKMTGKNNFFKLFGDSDFFQVVTYIWCVCHPHIHPGNLAGLWQQRYNFWSEETNRLFQCVLYYNIVGQVEEEILKSNCEYQHQSMFSQSLLDEPNPNSPANSVAAQLYQVMDEYSFPLF